MLKEFTEQHTSQTTVEPIIADRQNWHIYTSPMKRCLLTTRALVNTGIPITVKGDMYESGGCYKYDRASGQAHAYPGSTGEEIEEQLIEDLKIFSQQVSQYVLVQTSLTSTVLLFSWSKTSKASTTLL